MESPKSMELTFPISCYAKDIYTLDNILFLIEDDHQIEVRFRSINKPHDSPIEIVDFIRETERNELLETLKFLKVLKMKHLTEMVQQMNESEEIKECN